MNYPEEIVSVNGQPTSGGAYLYLATRRDGQILRLLTSRRRRYKWFHQWRCPTASEDFKIVHYFSIKERAAPVPAWVPGRAERLAPVSIVYL